MFMYGLEHNDLRTRNQPSGTRCITLTIRFNNYYFVMGVWQNLAGRTRDCDGLDELSHQGSMVQNAHRRYENEQIASSVSKTYMNSLHHVGGVQKGRNIYVEAITFCPPRQRLDSNLLLHRQTPTKREQSQWKIPFV